MYAPNMTPEIIEGVTRYYSSIFPMVGVDCLVHLANMDKDDRLYTALKNAAANELIGLGRCVKCGTLLHTQHYKEYHSELDGCPAEDMTTLYCPNCDFEQGDME